MKRILDHIGLGIILFFLFSQFQASSKVILSFALGLGFSTISYALSKNLLHSLLLAGFLLICIPLPSLFLFSPLLVYDCLWLSNKMGFLLIPAALLSYHFLSSKQLLFLICLSFIAWLLERSTYQNQKLNEILHETRDNGAEFAMIMEEKQQALLEKQDSELHLATVKERNRIAREIHDNVGHLLTRSILQMGALTTIYKEEPLRQQLLSVNDTLNQAMDSVRSSVHDLHDESIDLKTTLLELSQSLGPDYQVKLDYQMSPFLSKKVKYCIISIVKEALSNVVKHSLSHEIIICAREHPAFYQLFVEDTGPAKNSSQDQALSTGIGLINIKERVTSLGGTLQIRNQPGFRVFIYLPKKEELTNEPDNR